MATPAWQPSTLYPNGFIVRPTGATAPPLPVLTNATFDSGSTGWTLLGTMAWSATGGLSTPGCVRALGGTGNVESAFFAVLPGQSITASCQINTPNGSPGSGGDCNINWFDASHAFISQSQGGTVNRNGGTNYRMSVVTASAPANAAYFKVVGDAHPDGGASAEVRFDNFAVSTSGGAVPQGLVYRATQTGVGTSANSEPAWPGVVGVPVTDGTVVWEGVIGTRITYEAHPILVSGATEPAWPQGVGTTVADGSILWTATTRQVTQAPNSNVVAITASKVFAADKDIIRYSATVNPLDWTTTDNAGYLPSGLNQNGSNDTAVLNVYRSSLVSFSSSTFQNWQVDPDPANMALLDAMEGIGSTWQQAAQPVAKDLFYLAALGVRTVGISGGSTNLVNGDAGMPIDPLVRAEIAALSVNGYTPRGLYYPSLGQYWLAFGPNTYVYTFAQIGQVGAWSQYVFPWPVEGQAQLGNDLYLRSGDAVYRVDPSRLDDQNADGEDVEVVAEIQSHYLDMGSPTVTKMMIGVDLAGNGVARIAIGFNQTNLAYFTPDATVPADTVPGSIIPIPVSSPSFAMRLRFSSTDNPTGWEWLGSSFYINDFRPAV